MYFYVMCIGVLNKYLNSSRLQNPTCPKMNQYNRVSVLLSYVEEWCWLIMLTFIYPDVLDKSQNSTSLKDSPKIKKMLRQMSKIKN
ncbi:unnamed protein product [Acanthoscelides obtectus]|uniref:Uncharacterized protein n=1 Tax=Acanthoscelides obtectus TaxID=200917 RepID=A0A9P0NZ63_ACAOB|nr:unnamed protein product [Acanthoscelides obtectus]CAK1647101.1 hypothetical protein AOBTE_LOCUS15046 [Acanthoscelides obtectus]